MSSSVVRELITLWGFDIDQKPLKELDNGLNVIKSTLAGIGVAVGAATAAIGYLLNEAGEDEQTLIAFETMMGSAETAQKKLEELKDFAKNTPFDLKGLKVASQRLLAYSFDAEELIPTLSALGDISSGVGKDKLPNLILALGQVRAATRLTGMELRQFTEAGVPLLDELSKAMGKPPKEIQEMISAGKVPYEMVKTAIFNLTKEGGRFHNLMAKQSKSLLGLWSNFLDYINIISIEIGNSLLPEAKELFHSFLQWGEQNEELIKSGLIEFFRNLMDMVYGLVNVVKALYMAMSPVARALGGWNDLLGLLMKGFQFLMGGGLVYGIGLLAKGLFGLAMAWRTMGAAAMFAQIKVMAIPLAIGSIIVAIGLIAEDLIAFSQGRNSVFGLMVSGLDNVFAQMKEKFGIFGEIGAYLVSVLLTPIRAIINGFKSVLTLIDMVRGKKGIGEGFKEIGKNFLNNIPGLGGNTDSFSSALGIASNIGHAANQVQSNNNPVKGLGGMPFLENRGEEKTGKKVEQKIDSSIKIDVHGVDPSVQREMIESQFSEHLNNMFRETLRDGETIIER